MGAGAGVGFGVPGMVLSLIAEGRAQSERAAQALHNERLARLAAADALARGRLEAGQVRTEASRLISRQRVALAAAGVDPGVGTALDVMADTRLMSELDALTVTNNAAREAWGYEMEAQGIRRQAEFERQAALGRVANTFLTGLGNTWAQRAEMEAREVELGRRRPRY